MYKINFLNKNIYYYLKRLILNFAKQIDFLPEPKEELDTKNTDTKSQ